MSMPTLKNIRSALLFGSLMVVAPVAAVIEPQLPASALHECKFWEFFCTKNHVETHAKPPVPAPSTSYEGRLPVIGRGELWSAFANPQISTDFSSDERAKIWRSLEKAQEIVQKPEFENCVQKYVNLQTTGEYDGGAPGMGAVVFLSGWPSSSKRNMYIDYYTKSGKTLGNADIGIAGWNKPNEHFRVRLNGANLASLTEEEIAGTIVHELLHNWGYKHDQYDRTKKDEDRRGNFVYEAGWCAARVGADKQPGSLSLTGDEDEFYVD